MSRSRHRARTDRGHRKTRDLALGALLVLGVAALLAGACVTPGLLGRLSDSGILSLALQQRVQALRLLLMLAATVVLVASCALWRRGATAWLALVVGVTAMGIVVHRVYPNHLLARPQRLIGALLGEELLLSDYDPQPRLVTPTHEVLRARYPVINVHVHFRHATRRTPEALGRIMDACNVQRMVDLDGFLGEKLREEIATFTQRDPERLITFASVGFGETLTDWGYFRQHSISGLEDAKRLGAKGIKIWKNLGLRTKDEHGRVIPIDDPRIDSLWAKAGALGLPILIHVGDPAAFFDPIDRHNERYEELKQNPDWSFYGRQYPSLETVLT